MTWVRAWPRTPGLDLANDSTKTYRQALEEVANGVDSVASAVFGDIIAIHR